VCFDLVDRGLWHRLPGISGFGPACCRASVGSDADGHTAVGSHVYSITTFIIDIILQD
jgi:hypothetical protein